MGHYSPNMSDINIVVYGKDKFWKLMGCLQSAEHPDLRWKTYEEWDIFYKKRNRCMIHNKETYIKNMHRKKSEGFFKETLFVIFAAEEPNESWFTWGEEKYKKIGIAKIQARVTDNKNSIVRPGCYSIKDSKFLEETAVCKDILLKQVVFYSRDYCMLAYPGEDIEVGGILEEVEPKSGENYYRLVVGYFDSYISDSRDKEYIKVI